MKVVRAVPPGNNAQLRMSCGCTVQAYVEPAALAQMSTKHVPALTMHCIWHGSTRLTAFRPHREGGK